MSQLIVHPVTVVDNIPITRRITEIMTEKGKYYSIHAMAGRIGIHRETYRNMLKGERQIYTFELEKIAKDLKITVDRITQEDHKTNSEELRGLLNNRIHPERSLYLAEQLLSSSVGCTERCISLNYLGWAYFELKQVDQAHKAWLRAYELAEEISIKYEESELRYRVLRNLMLSYIQLKDFANALEISEEVESWFETEPLRIAELLYVRANVKESMGDNEEGRNLTYKSLEYCIKAESNEMIGRAYVNAAHFEYFLGNYEKSLEMLECAIEFLKSNKRIKLIAEKELVKTLIKLGQHERAVELIRLTLETAQELGQLGIEGKLYILLSRITDSIDFAQRVLDSEKYDNTIRYIACKFLIGHYRKSGDAFNFMHYHEVAEKLKQTTISDILDEKEL
ncbi:MAG: helix-turn-helix domain-containing protein [Neobacillus sp.]